MTDRKSPPPPSKPRILTPQDAKRLANPHSTRPEPPRLPSKFSKLPSFSRPTATIGPKSLIRKRFLPTLISGLCERYSSLRERYASLPTPVRRTCRLLRIFGTVLPIGLFFSEHVAQVMWVRGPSMTPYLNEEYEQMQTKSDMVLVSMWPWRLVWPWERERRLERGMVVTFRSPANSKHVAIKRVIGLPGDRIITREPCMKSTQIVPYNHVWVEGDAEDPRKTLDSNTYGPVSISLLTGRVVAVLRPRMRWLDWKDWEGAGSADDASLKGRDGSDYRQSARDRVVKEAVRLEQPTF